MSSHVHEKDQSFVVGILLAVSEDRVQAGSEHCGREQDACQSIVDQGQYTCHAPEVGVWHVYYLQVVAISCQLGGGGRVASASYLSYRASARACANFEAVTAEAGGTEDAKHIALERGRPV